MKEMKRLVTIILTVTMIFTSAIATFAEDDGYGKDEIRVSNTESEKIELSFGSVEDILSLKTSYLDTTKVPSYDINKNMLYYVPDAPGAWPYYYTTTQTYRCYGYAIQDLSPTYNPGTKADPSNYLDIYDIMSVTAIKNRVVADLRYDARMIRTVSSPTSYIADNEWMIAVRVGYRDFDGDGYISMDKSEADYHFLVKNDDGNWSHKPGASPTENLGNINPSTYNWRLAVVLSDGSDAFVENFYNSSIIYLAITF